MDSLEEQVKLFLNQSAGIELAYLFGSCATGRQTPSSDLDLAVASKQPMTTEDRMELIGKLGEAFNRPIDLVDLEHAGPTLLKEVLCRGKPLVCRNRDLKVRFMLRLWELEADLMPAFRRAQRERLEAFAHG